MEMEHIIPMWMLIPFVCQLLCIAIFPLTNVKHWWEDNRHKLLVSFLLGTPVAVWLCMHGLTHELEHQMVYDYVPFILLLMALYVTTGGICIQGDLKGTDVFQALDADLFAAGLLLLEFDRLRDRADDEIHETAGQEGEQNLNDDFNCFVHYFSVLSFQKLLAKLKK